MQTPPNSALQLRQNRPLPTFLCARGHKKGEGQLRTVFSLPPVVDQSIKIKKSLQKNVELNCILRWRNGD